MSQGRDAVTLLVAVPLSQRALAMTEQPTVTIVDDARESLDSLLRSVGLHVKPFRDQDLLDAIQLGLARDRAWLENEKVTAALRARFEALTPREREESVAARPCER
jgi:hypothetical protein